ncbi:zona pellucida glycoprotein d [Cynoglossus semilaevis]|uniref:Zona pellucida glycoprotein d n=1 Tax=Cynoglossus semilaevis TaxID=244447 RepID=A0A3P8X2T6_CYNSE|nr:uromodulin-like [Cynoglossus semilaevis]
MKKMTPKSLELSFLLVLLLGFLYHSVAGVGLCSVKHCTDRSRCVLSKDHRRCKCIVGYYGDYCEKDGQITVMCGSNYIAIRAVQDFFQYFNVPLEALHLPNQTCRAEIEVIDNVTYYMSSVSKEKYLACGGKPLETNFTHITYALTLMSDPQVSGNIVRDPVIKINYTCVFPYIRSVSLPFPIVPFSSEMVVRVDELDATIQMLLYTDHTYTKAFTSAPTIELRDNVFVEVAVTEPAGFFLLRVNECWATQSPQPNSTEGLVHTLLQNGCVNDPTVSFINGSYGEAGRNGETSTVRYSFSMFRFTTEPNSLYLHCTVQLCEPDDAVSCTPICKSVSKREAVKADPSQGLLSYGPIKIEVPHRPRASLLTTVVLSVAAVWIVGFFLVILVTVTKEGQRRLSQSQEH